MFARVLVWLLLPFATGWVKWQQSRILREGIPLTDAQLQFAVLLGIQHPERVRVRFVKQVPVPFSAGWIGKLLSRFSWMPMNIAGMALGYGIHLHSQWGVSKAVLRHELVHVAQYERLGGVWNFLKQYLLECLVDGYPNSALEHEAIHRSQDLLAGD